MKTKTYLKHTLNLLSDKKRWTQDAWARDARGRQCSVEEDCAEKFCLDGALFRVQYEFKVPDNVAYAARVLIEQKSRQLFDTDYVSVNDANRGGYENGLRILHAAIDEA
jgi:hypothetical protein